MSNEPPIYKEGETVPVPDKGGWIDGETGEYLLGGPPPVEPPPVEPLPDPPPTREGENEPKRDEPKAPSVPRKAS